MAVFAVALAVVAYAVAVRYGFVDATGQICGPPDQHGHKQCGPYDTYLVWGWQIKEALNSNSGLISAISGVIVAVFTASLWLSTHLMWRASQSQLRHSEDTARRQLRAYLDFDGVNFLPYEAGKKGPDHTWTGIGVQIVNFGGTPALKVIVFVEYLTITPAGEPHQVATDERNVAFISPTDRATVQGRFDIPNLIFFSLREDKGKMQVNLRVVWEDVFGDRHEIGGLFENYRHKEFSFVDGTRYYTFQEKPNEGG